VTGSGKSYTIANVIEQAPAPDLVLCHNKTLAAQLYSEFREFFPDNAVEYFVSYFDYYQPRRTCRGPTRTSRRTRPRNDEIDKLRHAAHGRCSSAATPIIVASVSCIYGLGAPVDYGATVVRMRVGGRYAGTAFCAQLVDIQYQRNDAALSRARSAYAATRWSSSPRTTTTSCASVLGDEVEKITEIDPLDRGDAGERNELNVYPASHYVTPAGEVKAAIVDIEAEMEVRVRELQEEGMELEAGAPAPAARRSTSR
jgi:excinuclease ABC subunit B